MTLRTVILAFLACLTAACGGQPDDRKDDRSDKGNPLLWEIARADGPNAGQVEGWLMGTIHALPSEAKWRSKEADEAIAKADVLAVEVADVGDGRAMASAFLPLAMSAGQPPLTERVPPRQREKVAELVGKTSYRLSDFSRIESWGAALILSQAVKTGAKSENGIDRALIADFGIAEHAFVGEPFEPLGIARKIQIDRFAQLLGRFPRILHDRGQHRALRPF